MCDLLGDTSRQSTLRRIYKVRLPIPNMLPTHDRADMDEEGPDTQHNDDDKMVICGLLV